MEVDVAVDDPRRDDVRRLLERHWAYAGDDIPPEHTHTLGVDELLEPSVTFVSARAAGELVGIGALREIDAIHGEFKSMHTAEAVRGQGVARAILEHLLGVARERGYRRVSLETGSGDLFFAAHALYERSGFVRCEPFGEYTSNPYSVCMTISLG